MPRDCIYWSMLQSPKQMRECPGCGKAYEKPPPGAFRVVCEDCSIVFDGKSCRSIEEVVEKTHRSRFGL
jgi:predicted amidophosphoribosyltransferase